MAKIYFATGNPHKIRELVAVLKPLGIDLIPARAEKLEIQSDSLEKIARFAAQRLPEMDAPIAVEDAGLFIEKLRGFPGPYSSYVYKTLGLWGILRLLEGMDERGAYFESAIGVKTPSGEVLVFNGKVLGTITAEPRGRGGFGFDPIFVPEGAAKTFAEMSLIEKNTYSHRAHAARALAKWLLG